MRNTPILTAEEKEASVNIGILAGIGVPLIKDGRLVAQLGVQQSEPREWTAEEILLVQETAERTWDAVERGKAEEAIHINEERMRAMKEAYQSVVNGVKLEASLMRLTQLVITETSGEARTAFYLANEESTFLSPVYDAGDMPSAYLDEIDKFPIGKDSIACGLAIPTGQPVITPDVFEEPEWKAWTYIAEKYDYRSCWSFPIKTRDHRAIGTFTMYFRTKREATTQDMALADVVTRTAAVIITNYQDNVSRTKAEQAMRVSETRLSSLVETVPTAIAMIDIHGKVILSNKEVQRFLPSDRVPSVDPERQSRWIAWYPNGERMEPENYPAARSLRGERVVPGLEFLYEQDDGSQVWCRVSSVPILDENGQVTGSLLSITDINELKKFSESLAESEQKFRSLVETYAQAVWETNARGKVEVDSPSWRAFTGQTFEEWVGTGWINAIHPDDREHIEKLWHNAVATGQNVDAEFRLQYAGNGYRWMNFRATTILGLKGNIVKWTCMILDIHQRKEAERLQKELNTKLQEMDIAKTNFFHNVSHEFRTPLALLIGPLEDIIKSGKTKMRPDELQKLQMSFRSAMRLQKLVNTLLDFARIEAGKLEAFYQPTDFVAYTTERAANFQSAIETAGLKYVVKTEAIDAPVYLNREMWEKIVFNLLSNAFKFTHAGKVEVIIREKKKNVELRIKDTGIGIEAKNMDRIFDRFVRFEGTRARTYEGTGIGLALIRELVTAHGGTIKVKSREGEGSEFTVSIPKGKKHLPAKQIFETREQLPADRISHLFMEEASGWMPDDPKATKRMTKKYVQYEGIRILVADDNADMREYLTHVLSQDYQVMAVEHGQKVIDFLKEGGQADLILADVMMPELDGLQMTALLKSDMKYAEIPVILLSARSSEESRLEGLRIGADDYLVKPFSSQELRAMITARIKAAQTRQVSKQLQNQHTIELEHIVEERTLQLRQLNESLQQRNVKLASLNDELTNFAYIANHDLREPLRKIQLFTSEIVQKDQGSLSKRDLMLTDRILSAAQRMNDLIEDILRYSQIASQPKREFTEVDLNDLLDQVLQDMKEAIQRSGANVATGKLPRLNCNAIQITQLFHNLISNALKFQPPGRTPEVVITGHVVPGETIGFPEANEKYDYLKLEVIDNGIGIEEKYLGQIFGIFQRLHNQSAYTGTGIGLAICKRIVENHQGFIVARSVPHEGSTFTCFIPILK
ncbi:MAG TPA: ATP-binding protein [Ohtaekwangia sp.]